MLCLWLRGGDTLLRRPAHPSDLDGRAGTLRVHELLGQQGLRAAECLPLPEERPELAEGAANPAP
ncbi:hypothetical protein GA0061091_13110 [Gordonia sp. v-85]|nr:hypothetical protein GA0061091_13110 [Gordonia sp. v-85]